LSVRAESPQVRSIPRLPTRYVGGVLTLAAAYYTSAKLGQALRYTGSVTAVWPPVGVGIAALYLWGIEWWPGVFLGDIVVNLQLYLQGSIPAGSLIGQQLGNMVEIIGGALILRRLIGSDARLDRSRQISGMFIAAAAATACSATIGTVSMLAGGVIHRGEIATFWRTWWLGDLSGALVILPLIVVWARAPRAALRRLCTWAGAFLVVSVTVVAFLAVSTAATVTYLVFPALIWAAYRFRAPGATLAVAIVAGVTIGMTADNLGAFYGQKIDDSTLSTQLYIAVAALTTLLLSAIVSERERSLRDLEEAKRREGERALEERYRIARDLHDSVSQALFSAVLQTRTAQKALRMEGVSKSGAIARSLDTIANLTRTAQSEMREFIFELRHDRVEGGLVNALRRHADEVGANAGMGIGVSGPDQPVPLSHAAQSQVFAIVRESLANVVKHSGAERAEVLVDVQPRAVLIDVTDDGCGFVPVDRPGHYGLESIRGRAAEIGGTVTITSRPCLGTAVHVEVPVAANGDRGLNRRT
jgi:signal transduction histidine kinase